MTNLNLESCLEQIPRDKNNCLASILFLHGYGANKDDLYPLAALLDPKKQFHWIFPDGIFPLHEFWPGARSWFPIPLAEFEKRQNDPKYFATYEYRHPPELDQSLNALMGLVATLDRERPLVLGGFSQGAMLASHLACLLPCSKLFLLSAATIAREELAYRIGNAGSTLENTEVFQAHGQSDQVLPFSAGERLRDLIERGAPKIQFYPFSGGHEIPPVLISKLAKFLDPRQ